MTYNLDDSTSLNALATLNSGSISESSEASGSGQNSISQRIGGKDSSVDNTILSNGAFIASTSAAASPDSTSLNQQVIGGGDVSLSLKGTQTLVSADQEACVIGGVISSSQSVSAEEGVTASQNTGMAGLMGYVGSGAYSEDKAMVANGNFLGDGTLTAELSSTTIGDAKLDGNVATDGVTWMHDEDLQQVAQNGGGVSMQGLRAVSDGMGTFEMNAASLDANDLGCMDQVATQAQGGSSSSYALTGWRWNTLDPKIQLYLKDDNNGLIPGTGLTATQAQTAIANAANTWDDAVAQNLFADGNTVIIDPSKSVDNPYDGYNVVGWKYLSDAPSALAYTRTRYDTPIVNGYWTAYESDVSLNTAYPWSTTGIDGTPYHSGDSLDVQGVALHELGHTIGLGDLYTLPSSDARKSDYSQIMNAYNDVQRTLGNGDIAGVMLLYPLTLGKTTLISPSGSITTEMPTYNWSNLDGTLWYDLRVDSPTGTVIDQWYKKDDVFNGIDCQVTPATSLGRGQYNWYIDAWNKDGYGPWSDPVPFYVQGGAPGKATLISPTGQTNALTTTFIWSDVAGTLWYNLRVNAASGSVIDQWYKENDVFNGINCQVTPSTSLGGGQYNWYIDAWNKDGYGPWSDPMSFSIQGGVPGKATLISPTGQTNALTTTFIWSDVAGTLWYNLRVNAASGSVIDQWYKENDVFNGINCQVTPSTSLGGGQYNWYIDAWNKDGYGLWSDPMSFSIQGGVPGVATLISPSGTITTQKPTYNWCNVVGTLWYNLRVDAPSGTTINQWYKENDVFNGVNCQVTPSILLGGGQYNWYIDAWNKDGYGPWSNPVTINVTP